MLYNDKQNLRPRFSADAVEIEALDMLLKLVSKLTLREAGLGKTAVSCEKHETYY